MRAIGGVVERGVRERGESMAGVPGKAREGVEEEIKGMMRFGWKEEAEKVRGVKRKREVADDGEGRGALGDEEVGRRVEGFGKRYLKEGIKAVFETTPEWKVDVRFKSTDGMDLHFEVGKATTEGGRSKFAITGPETPPNATKGETKLFQAIERWLGKRAKQNDLDYSLDMVAAYKDLRAARCVQCKRVMDKDGVFPAVRSLAKSKQENGTEEMKWIARHESCVDVKGP